MVASKAFTKERVWWVGAGDTDQGEPRTSKTAMTIESQAKDTTEAEVQYSITRG